MSILLPTESKPGALLFFNLHNLFLTAFESIIKLLKLWDLSAQNTFLILNLIKLVSVFV